MARAVLGRNDLTSDARFIDNTARTANREALDAILEEAFLSKTAADWVATLSAADVPCALVQDYHTALTEDPQIRHIGAVLHFGHPIAGPMTNLANLLTMHATPAVVPRPPPMLGQHSEEILAQHGFGTSQIAALMLGARDCLSGSDLSRARPPWASKKSATGRRRIPARTDGAHREASPAIAAGWRAIAGSARCSASIRKAPGRRSSWRCSGSRHSRCSCR